MEPHESLLKLQQIDSEIDALNLKKETLPERQELEKLEKSLAGLKDKRSKLEQVLRSRKLEQDKLDGAVSVLERKMNSEQERLYSGKVDNPKELASIQAEIKNLNERKDGIETALLEKMEEAGQLESEMREIIAQEQRDLQKSKELEQEVKNILGQVDKQITEIAEKRPLQTKKINTELLAEYEELKKEKQGLAVVRLKDGICQGCHVELPAKETDRVTNSNEINYCPRCGRILVP